MMQHPPHTFVRPPRGMPPKLERPTEPDFDRGVRAAAAVPPNVAYIRPPPRDVRPPPSTSSTASHLHASHPHAHSEASSSRGHHTHHSSASSSITNHPYHKRPLSMPLPEPQRDAYLTEYDDPYICFKCDNWVVLYEDEQTPSRTLNEFCHYCDKSMSSTELIDVHERCVHVIKKRKRREAADREAAAAARRRPHEGSQDEFGGGDGVDERVRPVSCRLCGVQFISDLCAPPNGLDSVKRSFRCDVCDLSFVTKEGVDIHSQVHTGYLVHACTDCTSRFSTSEALERHITVEAKHPPRYECQYCTAKFRLESDFESHMRAHNIQICALCNRKVPASQMPAHQEAFHRRVSSRSSRRRNRDEPLLSANAAHVGANGGSVALSTRGANGAAVGASSSRVRDHPYAQYSSAAAVSSYANGGHSAHNGEPTRGHPSSTRTSSRANGVGMNGYGPAHAPKRHRGAQRRSNGLPSGGRLNGRAAAAVNAEPHVFEDGSLLKCVCGHNNPNLSTQIIQCDECQVWQHIACVGVDSEKIKDITYLCEVCR